MVPKLPSWVEGQRITGADSAWARSSELLAGTAEGAFLLRGPNQTRLKVLASAGTGWLDVFDPPVFEHVSVSTERRVPNWAEMCWVKDLWWEAEDLVLQYHPPRSVYVNHHPYTLHLWRPVGVAIPIPPKETIA